MSIRTALNAANKTLMTYWPLHAFAAANPLWQFRNQEFIKAVSHPSFNGLMDIEYYYEQYQHNRISNEDLKAALLQVENSTYSDESINDWITFSRQQETMQSTPLILADQVEEYQFQKPTAWIKKRLFTILLNYFGNKQYESINLRQFWQDNNDIENTELIKLDAKPLEEAIKWLISKLKIPEKVLGLYFEAIYRYVYGWASFMNWRNQHPDNAWLPGKDTCTLLILFWLSYEYLIYLDHKVVFPNKPEQCLTKEESLNLNTRYIWQTAFELHYINALEAKFNQPLIKNQIAYDAQFIFCIDTRSEGFRRHLEKEGNFQTFGYAGFFGAVFQLEDDHTITYQAPALVKTTEKLQTTQAYNPIRKLIKQFTKVMHSSKKQLTAPFAQFEIVGFWFLPFMLYKTLSPKFNFKLKKAKLHIQNTLSDETKLQAATNLLTTIGLVKDFSPFVLICGHQSNTVNNPFKASLDCGACGGNSGIPNALVMCDILNDASIRTKLKDKNIHIPDNTKFIPSCHHTGRDSLQILQGKIPSNIKLSIKRAAEKLQAEKTKSLPGNRTLAEREQSWSELVPELALINNAAIIIGPRSLTLNQDLERRTFLHSYEPNLDQNGDILTSILSAPAIVAHWINSQYYFSTVSPERFGAGNKVIHNVLPNIGVLEGNLSDLKVGLPIQSTHFQANPIHEPRRITVVIYADKKILDKAIKASPDFKVLLKNKWVYLKHVAMN